MTVKIVVPVAESSLFSGCMSGGAVLIFVLKGAAEPTVILAPCWDARVPPEGCCGNLW